MIKYKKKKKNLGSKFYKIMIVESYNVQLNPNYMY